MSAFWTGTNGGGPSCESENKFHIEVDIKDDYAIARTIRALSAMLYHAKPVKKKKSK